MLEVQSADDLKIQSFLGHCILNYSKTKFEFHPVDKLTDGSCQYTGEAFKGWIRIATGGNKNTWLEVFLHETCHLDQAQENQEWFDSIDPYIADLEDWLGNKETKYPVSWNTVSKIVELEHDCEKRAIEKIKTFSLPINTEQYCQKANAYLISYINTLSKKKWESTPYNNPSKWSSMPKFLLPMEEIHKIAADTLEKRVEQIKTCDPKTVSRIRSYPINTQVHILE
jgi:hypothetical protein